MKCWTELSTAECDEGDPGGIGWMGNPLTSSGNDN